MKNLISISAVASLLLITGACSSTQNSQSSADGVYYTPSENSAQASESDQPSKSNYSKPDQGTNNTARNGPRTTDKEEEDYDYYNEDEVNNRNTNQRAVINNYQNYQYTSRINRFNNPTSRFNYFDPFYSGYRHGYDPYYNRSGLSITFSQRTGYYRDPFRQRYSRGFYHNPYRSYGYSHWRQPYALSYRQGYRQGYGHGYNDGYYGYSPFSSYGGGYNSYYGGGYHTGGYYQDATNTSSGTTEQPRESISKNYRDQGNNSNKNNSRNPGRIISDDPSEESSNNQESESDYDYYEPKDNRSSDLNQRNRSSGYQRDRNNNSSNNSQDRYNNSRDNNRNNNRSRDNSYSNPDRNKQNNRERKSYDRNRGRGGSNNSDNNDTNKPRR